MIYSYPRRVIAVILLLSQALTSCGNWEKGSCGYGADRCRQPGKEGHGKWVSEGSSYSSRPRSPLREGGSSYKEQLAIDAKYRHKMTAFILDTVPSELNKDLSLGERDKLKMEAESWLEMVDRCGSFNYRIKSIEEAEQKLREALRKIDKKREEIEAKQYEAEQVALGKQSAQISAEAGRPIKRIIKPGEKIAIPFLAQFQHVDIQIEPTKGFDLLGNIDLTRFTQVNLHTNTTFRSFGKGRKTLHSNGFMKIRASMQGESSFTIRPVENFKLKMLIHPGGEISMNPLQSFKNIDIRAIGSHAEIRYYANKWIADDLLIIKASMQGEEYFALWPGTTVSDFEFTLQPGEKADFNLLKHFKQIDIHSAHDIKIDNGEFSSVGFLDVKGTHTGTEKKLTVRSTKDVHWGNANLTVDGDVYIKSYVSS